MNAFTEFSKIEHSRTFNSTWDWSHFRSTLAKVTPTVFFCSGVFETVCRRPVHNVDHPRGTRMGDSRNDVTSTRLGRVGMTRVFAEDLVSFRLAFSSACHICNGVVRGWVTKSGSKVRAEDDALASCKSLEQVRRQG